MTTTDEITSSLSDERVDGRTLRRTRNRDAVIDALLHIIREGNLQPGAAGIADRAGVSHRSIFRYFADLDDLVSTAIDHDLDGADPLVELPGVGEDCVTERISTFVDARIALFEHIDATMQLARIRAHSIPSIDDSIADMTQRLRAQIPARFEPELAHLGEEQQSQRIDGILVQTNWDSYSTHRRVLGNGTERLRAAWVGAVTALVA